MSNRTSPLLNPTNKIFGWVGFEAIERTWESQVIKMSYPVKILKFHFLKISWKIENIFSFGKQKNWLTKTMECTISRIRHFYNSAWDGARISRSGVDSFMELRLIFQKHNIETFSFSNAPTAQDPQELQHTLQKKYLFLFCSKSQKLFKKTKISKNTSYKAAYNFPITWMEKISKKLKYFSKKYFFAQK